jgi:pimeloyl-ACP methyl ester carboxylesterase
MAEATMGNRDSDVTTFGASNRMRRARNSERGELLAGLPVVERRLSLNQVSTAVLEGGTGSPVVLLHGPAGYAAHWLNVIGPLTTHHRVVVPDLPGHGASEPLTQVNHDAIFCWLDDLIECTCDAPPVLVGHTLGGAIAARFAAESSVRLRALVLVDTLGLTHFQPAPEFGEALHGFLSAPTAHTHDQLWASCMFDLAAVRSRLGAQWERLKAYNLDRALAPGRLAALASMMEQFAERPIPPAVLARIAVPTVLIWGREDRATPLQVARDASARYDWELHIIDNAADDPTLEQPQAFVNVLRTVIAAAGVAKAAL